MHTLISKHNIRTAFTTCQNIQISANVISAMHVT